MQIPARSTSAEVAAAEGRFVLVRAPSFGGAAASMLPWFFTLLVLGVVGALAGERLASSPGGLVLFAGFAIVLIGFGLWKTLQSTRRAKPELELMVERQQLSLVDAAGTKVWQHAGNELPFRRETYVYRTRYGSHRFPVIKLGSPGSELRLAVWDPSFARAGDPDGPRPPYLVGVPDWPRLERVLAERCKVRL